MRILIESTEFLRTGRTVMLYHITGTLADKQKHYPAEEYRKILHDYIVPSLHMIERFVADGRVLACGVISGTTDFVAILDLQATSHLAVRELLIQLPLHVYYHWQVVPLESLADWHKVLHD